MTEEIIEIMARAIFTERFGEPESWAAGYSEAALENERVALRIALSALRSSGLAIVQDWSTDMEKAKTGSLVQVARHHPPDDSDYPPTTVALWMTGAHGARWYVDGLGMDYLAWEPTLWAPLLPPPAKGGEHD